LNRTFGRQATRPAEAVWGPLKCVFERLPFISRDPMLKHFLLAAFINSFFPELFFITFGPE